MQEEKEKKKKEREEVKNLLKGNDDQIIENVQHNDIDFIEEVNEDNNEHFE